MQIDSIIGAAPSTSTAPGSKKTDALGRDAFLTLLVTQLQHQDPTAPMADGEFLAQLAQFTSLEQLQQMNKSLETIAQFYKAMDGAASSSSPGSTSTPSEGKV